MTIVLVSHFHWDREWYRTFDGFRARLVDAVDRVLDLVAADAGYHFLLDGQTVLLEDYLEIRPQRRGELEAGLREGRLSAGPWYVQPDSLLPSGEAHVRNLLQGRRTGTALGPVSRIGYVPDSFGHPAQLPQILAGFGISTFVYWRGNGDEIDALGPLYRWQAPDGSAVQASLLSEGYFNAACLPADADEAARGLAPIVERLTRDRGGPVLLMNGIDHMLPDPHTKAVAEALARHTGRSVHRGLLEHAVGEPRAGLPLFRGELVGARLANLLAGVWSTRTPMKLANRRCETLLEGWAEPWTALARHFGVADESPALRLAWRSVLQNQAHDSICGCSIDPVAARVMARYAEAEDLAQQTITRVLERLAGLGVERRTPWTAEQDIAVFNPSPRTRTDVVRVPLDVYPAMRLPLGVPEFPPLLVAAAGNPGFEVDGTPVRICASPDPGRARWLPGQDPIDLEFVAADVPAFGCRRFRLIPAAPAVEEVDDGREIEVDGVRAAVAADGTLDVRLGSAEFRGLFAVEDRGDRGDTYDFDPVADDAGPALVSVRCERRRHPSGIAGLVVERVFRIPAALEEGRERRAAETVLLPLSLEVRVAPGVPRLDVAVHADNTALDHRLRLLFPTGRAAEQCRAAGTFDVVTRSTAKVADAAWLHPAPSTFPHQGWVHANGLTVIAPGLPEAEVDAGGTIAITLLRSVGWLARYDLRSRPIPAGPPMPTPGAQVTGAVSACFSLFAGEDAAAARDAELGLRGVFAGDGAHLAEGRPLLSIEPAELLLSALKPAEDGDGLVARVLNPTDDACRAVLRLGLRFRSAVPVRLDEEPDDHPVAADDGSVRFDVPARALRSIRLR